MSPSGNARVSPADEAIVAGNVREAGSWHRLYHSAEEHCMMCLNQPEPA